MQSDYCYRIVVMAFVNPCLRVCSLVIQYECNSRMMLFLITNVGLTMTVMFVDTTYLTCFTESAFLGWKSMDFHVF